MRLLDLFEEEQLEMFPRGDTPRRTYDASRLPVQAEWTSPTHVYFQIGPFGFNLFFMGPVHGGGYMQGWNEHYRSADLLHRFKKRYKKTGLFPIIDKIVRGYTLEFVKRVKPKFLWIYGADALRNDFNRKVYPSRTPSGYRFELLRDPRFGEHRVAQDGTTGVAWVREDQK